MIYHSIFFFLNNKEDTDCTALAKLHGKGGEEKSEGIGEVEK